MVAVEVAVAVAVVVEPHDIDFEVVALDSELDS